MKTTESAVFQEYAQIKDGPSLYRFRAVDPHHLTIEKDGEPRRKVVTVEDDHEHTFRIMKSKLKAADGAPGLYRFMCRTITESFGEAYTRTICREAWENVRPAKA